MVEAPTYINSGAPLEHCQPPFRGPYNTAPWAVLELLSKGRSWLMLVLRADFLQLTLGYLGHLGCENFQGALNLEPPDI